MTDWSGYFKDGSGALPATGERIREIEEHLGVRLPDDYRDLLRTTGGGNLDEEHCFLPGHFGGGWPDGVLLTDIFGNGDDWFTVDAELGSKYLTEEWGYPDVGMVLGMSESGGHDALLYNFRHPDHPVGAVLFWTEDQGLCRVADSLTGLLESLTCEPEY